MTTFHRAFEDSTSWRKRLYCAWPSMVRCELLILSLHFCATGAESDGIRDEKIFRLLSGAVGARSGSPGVCGLSQTPLAEALALRNDRSSRKNSSRFLPHWTER